MKQVPDYIAEKTLGELLVYQQECEHYRPYPIEGADPSLNCTSWRLDGTPGCSVCELVVYWQSE